jgi:protein-arginine kinase activator protein McsA
MTERKMSGCALCVKTFVIFMLKILNTENAKFLHKGHKDKN